MGADAAASPTGQSKQLLATLGNLSPRTRTIGFFLVVVDLIFGASIFGTIAVTHLSNTEFVVATITLGILLALSLAAIYRLECQGQDGERSALTASRGSPTSAVLDGLVNSTLQAICRATSLPKAPDDARVRAFIFRVEGGELVCKYYWALNPTSEKVNLTRFPLTPEASAEIAVVRCAMTDKIVRTAVRPLPATLETGGEVDQDLTYVLAAPIHDDKGAVWGTVDFDTSSQIGEERLATPLADAAIFQLTQHLQVIFSLRPQAVPAEVTV